MTTHTIPIKGLPEGWEVKPIKLPSELFNGDKTKVCYGTYIELQKTKPRRIVLEETGEDNRANLDGYFDTQSFDKGSLLIYNQPKIWRIKEE